MSSAEATELEVDVQFGNVSIGDETARVGVKIDRGVMTLEQADECLCGKRLTGRIEVCAPGEQQGQKSLKGMENERPHMDGTFDVKRFGVGLKEISAGLTFGLGSIDVSELDKFAKKNGRLIVTDAQFLPEDDEEGESEPTYDDHEDVGPRPRGKKSKTPGAVPGDSGAAMSIYELVKHKLPKKKCEALAEAAGGSTIGHLEKLMRDDAWWHKKAAGVGESWIDRISDALISFRKQHPVPTGDPQTKDLFGNKPAETPAPATTKNGREIVKVPTEAIKKAYTAGCEAAIADNGDTNPNDPGTPEHTAWNNGWKDTNAGDRN